MQNLETSKKNLKNFSKKIRTTFILSTFFQGAMLSFSKAGAKVGTFLVSTKYSEKNFQNIFYTILYILDF